MKCPVCGEDCVQYAHEVTDTLSTVFSPCPNCRGRTLDKRAPLPDAFYAKPCACGKRFIDEVFAHLYVIMTEEGVMKRTDPLYAVGTPLVHPGFSMSLPPYLPEKSLVLLSRLATQPAADRIIAEVPEVRGVVRSGDFVPGVVDEDLSQPPRVYDLLSGCDVRADIFYTSTGPLVLYKQQALTHIEFPRGYEPKILSVEKMINANLPSVFVDACTGVGTLGLTAAQMGIRRVVMNDAWYGAAFWAAFNVQVNAENFLVSNIVFHQSFKEMRNHPVVTDPVKVAESEGAQKIEVYQGDFRALYHVLPRNGTLSALDLFNKKDSAMVNRIKKEWEEKVGGEVFIP
jgi:hypothetical protein